MNVQLYYKGGDEKRGETSLWAAVCGTLVSILLSAVFIHPASATQLATVDVRIETPEKTIFDQTVYISDYGCSIKDVSGTTFTLKGLNALCALDAAATQGAFAYQVTSYAPYGLFLNSVAGMNSDAKNYWLYYVNIQSPTVSMDNYVVKDGDEVLLSYGGISMPLRLTVSKKNPRVSDPVEVTVNAALYHVASQSFVLTGVPNINVKVSDGVIETLLKTDASGKAVFTPSAPGTYTLRAEAAGYTRSVVESVRVYKRYARMTNLNRERRRDMIQLSADALRETAKDGVEQESPALIEWGVMALASVDRVPNELADAVKGYDRTIIYGASNISRHILALQALHENAHDFNDVNYVQELFNTMGYGQFGNEAVCNDDIFAVLALLSAGMSPDTEGLQQGLGYTLKCVAPDGGVSFLVEGASDVDTTAAWLMMISRYSDVTTRLTDAQYAAQQAALDFLRDAQNPDGGWGYASGQPSNSSSTAWVLMALRAQHNEAKAMTTNYRNGFNYLRSVWDDNTGAVAYDTDGTPSLEYLNTAYAVMALTSRPFPVNLGSPVLSSMSKRCRALACNEFRTFVRSKGKKLR